ncbi:hypothetical protein Sango_2689200 [Sesamum angolense]|uniref:Uncharacterized protein n=1 Tax=Sesamum angolense TaxID=2727404 RepID=A0AAE2BHJ3_9LAMI|nr:hypothetical protein Sango_2689200 [Sesamum angolense]
MFCQSIHSCFSPPKRTAADLHLNPMYRIPRASSEGHFRIYNWFCTYAFSGSRVFYLFLSSFSSGLCPSIRIQKASIFIHMRPLCVSFSVEHLKDLPTELIEESKFVPLILRIQSFVVAGFPGGRGSKVIMNLNRIQRLLKELDGEFLEVIFCTEDMINRSLWEAVNTKQSNLEASKVAASLPRICFLSGLTGEEMMMFIDAFPESGLEPPVFAALVPNSADKPLAELIDEIMGDHEMLSASGTS